MERYWSYFPVIGITCSCDEEKDRLYLSQQYIKAVEAAGGLPLLLPYLQLEKSIEKIIQVIDGVLLPGGGDVDPIYFGEEPHPLLHKITPERDTFEVGLIKKALSVDLPILGICRGIQVLNIAAGGTVYQDIGCLNTAFLKHYQEAPDWHPTHTINIEEGSMLWKIMGEKKVRVNSFHHQVVNKVAEGYKVTACSVDGVIEGLESINHRFVVGVQFHPECMWERDKKFLALFEHLVAAAGDKSLR